MLGCDRGILTPQIFTMMVLMALVTTAMTGPLVSLSLTSRARTLSSVARSSAPAD